MSKILELKNLKKYFGKVKAVNDISFDVEKAECFGLLGPNGAGKSTTLEMIQGLISPNEGEILFKSEKFHPDHLEKIGVQHQETSLPIHLTVKETLETFKNLYRKKESTEALLEKFHLQEFKNQMNDKISGGQRQRLLLAMAVSHSPEFILLDEPTTGLDPQARRNVWNSIKELKSKNHSILLTTHYMEEAEYLCDRLAIIDHGKIIAIGKPQDLLKKNFSSVVIQFPYSGSLFDTIRSHFNAELVNDKICVYVKDIDEFLNQCSQFKISMKGIQVRDFNLEDLFLKLTGEEIRQ